jgi:protease I
MAAELAQLKIAILVDNGFEQDELTQPRKALEGAGARVTLVSPAKGKVKGWKSRSWGDEFDVEQALAQAKVTDYDALYIPGGVMSPDSLRMNEAAVAFTRAFFDAKKPVASVCHGPWMLIEAGAVRGRKLTSFPSLKSDLKNAGANWVDEEVVYDNGLVTSRGPSDLPAFSKKIIEVFGKARGQKAA